MIVFIYIYIVVVRALGRVGIFEIIATHVLCMSACAYGETRSRHSVDFCSCVVYRHRSHGNKTAPRSLRYRIREPFPYILLLLLFEPMVFSKVDNPFKSRQYYYNAR